MTQSLVRLGCLVIVLGLAAPAAAVETTSFVAVHDLGGRPWVELERIGHEPPRGLGPARRLGAARAQADSLRRSELSGFGGGAPDGNTGFLHVEHRAIPGARALGGTVTLVGSAGACVAHLGRPRLLGVWQGDEGYGVEPTWIRAAPALGCRGAFVLGVRGVRGPVRIAVEERPEDHGPDVAAARDVLVRSAAWRGARGDWAGMPADFGGPQIGDLAFRVGHEVIALARDFQEAECGSIENVWTLVRRDAQGARTVVLAPATGDGKRSIDLVGDLDGDGRLEAVFSRWEGFVVVGLDATGLGREVFASDGIPFFGCPC